MIDENGNYIPDPSDYTNYTAPAVDTTPAWWSGSIANPANWTQQGLGTVATGLGLIGGLTGNKDAPASPNYAQLAQQDTQANRVDTYTPYGSSVWATDPNNPNHWTNNQTLSPSQQNLLDQSNTVKSNLGMTAIGMSNKLGNTLGGAMPGTYNPWQSTNDATNQIMARVNPMLDRQDNQLRTQLANQGITQGSEAYTNAMTDFGKQRNDAYSQAALSGINTGQSQQAQMYSQGMTNRNQPLNELNALQNGSQVQNPTFSQAPTAGSQSNAGVNTYNANMQGVNAANANNANMTNGLFSLGSTLWNNK
jgi:hypothetical protein